MVFMFELLAMHRMAQGISRHSEKSRCHYMVGRSSSSPTLPKQKIQHDKHHPTLSDN